LIDRQGALWQSIQGYMSHIREYVANPWDRRMDAFFESLIVRAATIDERLSDDFKALPGQKGDAEPAARRLAAWCSSCASGDWSLFNRRLERDRLSIAQVLARFATVCRSAPASPPPWIEDAIWIDAALHSPTRHAGQGVASDQAEPCAFEHLFAPVIEQADARLWADIDARVAGNLNESARACLRHSLHKELSRLSAPAIYERFVAMRKASATSPDACMPRQGTGTSLYDHFIADMKARGFRLLFEDKPVLLRLIASLTRQWIDTSREFVLRLAVDLPTIRRDILASGADGQVVRIEGDISDPHNDGRSVQIVSFEGGFRVLYKTKDLRLDFAWHNLIERLNRADPPVELRAVRAIARDGYGWTEFIDHTGCTDPTGFGKFFRRAGAWLALFHCFAATDMHQENMIASGDHPVPIDLEMILQAVADEHNDQDPEGQAHEAATDLLANSVMMVGLLPAYGRSVNNKVFAIGGMTADWNAKIILQWHDINTDAMRPTKAKEVSNANPNLPHLDSCYAKFGDHLEDFISGFEDYANFLLRQRRSMMEALDDFAGVYVRKVIRPTRFYYMLLERLKNHRNMGDGVVWSAQADFVARLADWEKDFDPVWPLQRAERTALAALNVPHFTVLSTGDEIRDAAGVSIRTGTSTGMDRVRARIHSFDEKDIGWQIDVIRQNTNSVLRSAGTPAVNFELKDPVRATATVAAMNEIFAAEADSIAKYLSRCAIRRGPGAAWIGLDWLGDSEAFQLVCLGPELYNGVSGIALFLAAHAAVTGSQPSGELARAGVSYLRKNLKSRNAARIARSLGIGGAIGLGSIVYALTVMSKCLHEDDLLEDAYVAAELFTDDLIAADKQLDAIGGSAGAILCLLRLYSETQSSAVLSRAAKCGEYLIAQPRVGPEGRRSWVGQGSGPQPLNGMSHGAAGFAYALASLSAATGREEFACAASECVAFENTSFDAKRHNWPDLRGGGEPHWPCQWCHGAPGIGLARIAAIKRGGMDSKLLTMDVRNAVVAAERGWPAQLDTLCCGTLGSIEFLREAGSTLGDGDLQKLASRRLMSVVERATAGGDYRWNSGKRQFNLGLFRGIAGVGYTVLRQVDASLPNVLIWE
jgi:type 2 lantibiotic biosynthesis protein LanM